MPEPEVTEITLDELVRRIRAAAEKMGKRNENRVLLFNTALALEEMGRKLEEAWGARRNTPKSALHLPGGGLHLVN